MTAQLPRVTVCIPTMGRFDFLRQSIPRYLRMTDVVDRVVVTDETGEDVARIRESAECAEWAGSPRLEMHVNKQRLGAYGNKIECVRAAAAAAATAAAAPKAAGEAAAAAEEGCWVALIDSDNFAPEETYFRAWHRHLRCSASSLSFFCASGSTTMSCSKDIIYAPGVAEHTGESRSTHFAHFKVLDASNISRAVAQFKLAFVVLNTGNFIVHSSTYLKPCTNSELNRLIARRPFTASDAAARCVGMLLNGAALHVVPEMKYEHVRHPTSLFASDGETPAGRQDTAAIMRVCILEGGGGKKGLDASWLPRQRFPGCRDL